jgi:DNA gyrase subunit A
MAGIKLGAKSEVIAFSVLASEAEAIVVTVSGATGMIAGTDAGRAKSSVRRVPGQGTRHRRRARARVPEGRGPTDPRLGGRRARARGRPDGSARALPEAGAKRDGSGQSIDGVIGSIGGVLGA